MTSLAKFGVAVLSLVLGSLAVSPLSCAQSGPSQTLIQMRSTGGYLGIQMDDVTVANMSKYKLTSEKGVIVRSVVQGSPAEKAGLRADDVIQEYGGIQVWSAVQFSRLVEETPLGRKVELAVSREGKRVNLSAEIGSRSGSAANDRMFVLPRDRAERDIIERVFPFPLPDERDGGPVDPARRPRLGLTLQPLSDQLAQYMGVPGKKGVLVASVLEGSPAAGKIRAGDVIIAADGKEVREPEELTRIVRDKADGSMTLKIIRDKREIAVDVSLPTLPAEEGRGLKL